MPLRGSASPTQLLWAHQLKREHGFLLERIKGLEDKIKTVDVAVKTAAATADERIDLLGQSLVPRSRNELDEEAIAKLEKEVMDKIEDMQGELEVITLQISDMNENFIIYIGG